jgi:hypothetical protein
VFCPEYWSNEKSILLRHVLTSATSRLEFVITRNHVQNLRLWDVMLTLRTVLWLLCSWMTYIHYTGMNATTVVQGKWPLCSINRHNAVCSRPVMLAVKQPAVLCHKWENIFTSKQIRTKFYRIQNLILKMDIRAFLDSVANDRIEKSMNVHWINMQNYKGQKENFWMRW